MPFSYAQYAGNGSTTTFSVPFPYLLKAHVKLYTGFNILTGTYASLLVDGVDYTWTSGTQVQTTVAPANGVQLTILRDTPDASQLVPWQDGSNLIADDLNNADLQNLYVVQEQQDRNDAGITQSTVAATAATAATSTANTALSNSSAAQATAASAVTTANAANATSASAVTTANAANATANAASTSATNAVSTANAANATAASAVTTANAASASAAGAVTTANAADVKADSAIAAVASSVNYTSIADVAAIPASPANNAYIEIQDSTGLESFSPLAGRPAGFVGDSGLKARIWYSTAGATWNWIDYSPTDSDGRYLRLSTGGALTGQIQAHNTTSAATPGYAFNGDTNTGVGRPGADELSLITGGSVRLSIDSAGAVAIPGALTVGSNSVVTTGDTGTVTSAMLVNGTIVDADINAAAAISGQKVTPAFGAQNISTTGTATAASYAVTGSTAPANGIFLPSSNTVGISTNSAQRISVTGNGSLAINNSQIYLDAANARLGIGTASPIAPIHSTGQIYVSASNNNQILLGNVAGSNLGSLANLSLDKWCLGIASTIAGGAQAALTFDTNRRIGIGMSQPELFNQVVGGGDSSLVVGDSTQQKPGITLYGSSLSTPIIAFADGTSSLDQYKGYVRYEHTSDILNFTSSLTIEFWANSLRRASIDSSGRFTTGFFGTPSAGSHSQYALLRTVGRVSNGQGAGTLNLANGNTFASANITAGADVGVISFSDYAGHEAALIQCQADATSGANDYPGRLVFSTTADGASTPTERMRISQNGTVQITGVEGALTASGAVINNELVVFNNRNTGTTARFAFRSNNVERGSITWTDSATAYNTSSDYRLKENISPVADGIDRLRQLKPCRFNFIIEPGRIVDGFIAHEVQDIVPEAINGEKDAVDEDGNPIYQGIDQSKLVPLLTAALQEAIAKIETQGAAIAALEAKVAALEAQ